MKRLFAAALAAFASLTFGATLSPIQLLNPAGSTSGQVIMSTGASTAPAWSTVTLSGVSGTLAIVNGGTGATTAAAALTNLNGASLAANTFTAPQTAPTFVSTSTTNSTSSTTGAIVTAGGLGVAGDIYSGGSYHGNAFIGAGTIANTPISGSTGSFTTLSSSSTTSFSVRPTFNGATPWDSSNLASPASTVSPAFTGTVTTAALTATGLITPSATIGIKGTSAADNAQAGSWGEFQSGTASGVSLTTGTSANCASMSLTAGDWDVSGQVTFSPAATTTMTGYNVGISTTSATLAANGNVSMNITMTTGLGQIIAAPLTRVNVSSATTVYLVGNLGFGTSTATCSGFVRARRVR